MITLWWLQIDILQLTRQRLENFLLPVVIAVVVFIIWLVVISYVSNKVRKKIIGDSLEEDTYAKKMWWLVAMIVSNTLMIFNVLIAFQIIGLDVGILMAWISFGIWFAMQQVLGNMISGIMIITNPKLHVGDTIQLLGDINQFGTIEWLHIRYTIVRLFDKRKMIIPNTKFIATPFKVFKNEPVVRSEVRTSIALESNIEDIQQKVIALVNTYEFIEQPEQTQVIVEKVDETGMNILVFFYHNPNNPIWFLSMRSTIRSAIKRTFDQYNIEIPYTHQVVTVEHAAHHTDSTHW